MTNSACRRALGGAQADFARQLAERNRTSRPQKKFRSSAPKGAKIADGYVDRTAAREAEAADDRAERLRALEESLKNEEIDQATFEKLRFQIAGGDLESTHLVKGLDFKLLERIRKGEDVYGEKKEEDPDSKDEAEPGEDVDDAFDQLERQEVEAIAKAQTEKKKGELSTVKLAPGKKRTRDQIIADLKASRAAAKAAQESALGDRFRKIGEKQKAGSRIERDSKGREVLIIVDEDGHEKRKVRKTQPQAEVEDKDELLMPDKNVAPLGMEVPEQYRKKEEPEEDDDMDIFEGVGDDYDPLAGIDGSDSDSDSDNDMKEATSATEEAKEPETASDKEAMPPPPVPKPKAAAKPNYFQGAKTGLVSEEEHKALSMDDPAIQAVIKRAAALKRTAENDSDEDDEQAAMEKKAREERHKKMLQSVDRDEEDMDMGFGTSRHEDEEDFDDSKVKLSNWGQGGGDDDDDGDGQEKGGKKKRKPRKRKGDANNAADVLRVMESRKG